MRRGFLADQMTFLRSVLAPEFLKANASTDPFGSCFARGAIPCVIASSGWEAGLCAVGSRTRDKRMLWNDLLVDLKPCHDVSAKQLDVFHVGKQAGPRDFGIDSM